MPIASAATVATESRVRDAIARAASSKGVDFRFLYDEARNESGLNPNAKAATSSAAGLFQFTRQTWLQIVKTHGAEHGAGWAADAIGRNGSRLAVLDASQQGAIEALRFDPEFSSAMAAELTADNRGRLEDGLGRQVDPTELYLAHFLGSAGAVKFLTAYDADPASAAAPMFPAAAAANRSIFYRRDGTMRSLADIRAKFADKLGGDVSLPSPTFAEATQMKPMPAAMVPGAPRWTQTHRSIVQSQPGARLEMAAIEPLPPRLSLEYAARAYQRLAEIGA